MRAYVVVTAEPGKAKDIAHAFAALGGRQDGGRLLGVGDVYSVANLRVLNSLVLDKVQSLPVLGQVSSTRLRTGACAEISEIGDYLLDRCTGGRGKVFADAVGKIDTSLSRN